MCFLSLPIQLQGDTLMTVKNMEDWMLTMEHKLVKANLTLDKLRSKEKELGSDNSRVRPAYVNPLCLFISCALLEKPKQLLRWRPHQSRGYGF